MIGTCAGPAPTSISGTSAASGATVGGMTPGRVTQGKHFTKTRITDLMVTDPIKADLTKSRSEAGRTDQIGGLQLGARADRPPLGSVRSGEARSPPTRTQHRTASTATVKTQSHKIRTQRRAVRGSADHADKSTVPIHRSHCSAHHLYK